MSYLGPPAPIASFLHEPDQSLVTQSVDPKYLHMLNLAGFGMMSWNHGDTNPAEPLVYQSTAIPVYDRNLHSLARKVSSTCLLAHIRGVAYRVDAGFGEQNLHPFHYKGTSLALAHNGDLHRFSQMKAALHRRLKPEIAVNICGTTDSEWVYALLLSQLDNPGGSISDDQLLVAVERTLTVLRELRREAGIHTSSSLNLFIADGHRQLAVRFTFDFGRYVLDPAKVHEANARFLSLWYTTGERFERSETGRFHMTEGRQRAALLASEPLSRNDAGWVEVPEYSGVLVTRQGECVTLRTTELDA